MSDLSETLGHIEAFVQPRGSHEPTLVVTRFDSSTAACLSAAGEIDLASAPILASHLQRAIDDGDGVVAVDLGDVTFIDSSGVNALVTAHLAAPTRLRLTRLHPNVRRVLEIADLLDVFAPSEDSAAP